MRIKLLISIGHEVALPHPEKFRLLSLPWKLGMGIGIFFDDLVSKERAARSLCKKVPRFFNTSKRLI